MVGGHIISILRAWEKSTEPGDGVVVTSFILRAWQKSLSTETVLVYFAFQGIYSSQCKKSICKFILLNFFRNLTLALL